MIRIANTERYEMFANKLAEKVGVTPAAAMHALALSAREAAINIAIGDDPLDGKGAIDKIVLHPDIDDVPISRDQLAEAVREAFDKVEVRRAVAVMVEERIDARWRAEDFAEAVRQVMLDDAVEGGPVFTQTRRRLVKLLGGAD